MKAAGSGGNPDFTCHPVAVDDDLAAIVELDLDDAVGRGFKIQIGCFECLLDVRQRGRCSPVEFNFGHDVPC
jgi:hypothetical protein